MTTLPVKISYPPPKPFYLPVEPGTGKIFTFFPQEAALSVLEDENLAWLGLIRIELPPEWDGGNTEFWFHPKETGVYLLSTTPSSGASVKIEVLS